MGVPYPEAIQKLIDRPDLLGELVPRTKGAATVKAELDALKVGSGDMAACVRAALYLCFNFLDESHTISQGIHTAEGSYWHAIMHRREPDSSNAKYWFKRVGHHPVFDELSKLDAVQQALGDRYDPFAFVDFCEEAETDKSRYQTAVEIQRQEWSLLFEHCLRATAKR